MDGVKTDLRDHFRTVRLAMDREDVDAKSQIICAKLVVEIGKKKLKNLLAYQSITKLNEVDIQSFLAGLESIAVDLLNADPDQSLPGKKYDVILVPCLAFDKDSYRLGWGGGFYDRLLATQPQSLKIGLCFQNGFVEDGLPHEPHDVPLDKIITEI
jgi:5-formyltetrahydrofolate cyclo-ligase